VKYWRSRHGHYQTALSLSAQVAAQAELIVSNLRQTNYQHTEHIGVDRGIYDCDGFVGLS
jgi:hypothetical protein